MAWAAGAQIGAANTKTSGTTISTGAVTSSATAGSVLIAFVTIDNAATASGASATVASITDTKTNTWSKLGERTTSSGVAADGITVAVFAALVNTALVAAADSVTANLSASVAAKAIVVHQFTVAAGSTWSQAGATQAGSAVASATLPALSVTGLASREYLFAALDGWEVSGVTYTKDANYTLSDTRATTGGGTTTNVQMATSYRIATLTGSTHAATVGTAVDSASILVALSEVVSAPTSHPVTLSASVTSAPLRRAAAAHAAPLVSVALSAPVFQRSVRLLRSSTSSLVTSSVAVRAYGRALAVAVAVTPTRLALTGLLRSTAMTTTILSVRQVSARRGVTVTISALRSGLIVFPHAFATTITAAPVMAKTVLRVVASSATTLVTRAAQTAASRATSVSTATLVGFQAVNSLILRTLSASALIFPQSARSVRATRAATASIGLLGSLQTTATNLLTSPTLVTSGAARDPLVLPGRVLAITVTAATSLPRLVAATHRVAVSVAGKLLQSVSGVPVIGDVIAVLIGGDREFAATGGSETEQAAAPGEAETTTMTGSEDA